MDIMTGTVTQVTQHTYRSARVLDVFLRVPRDSVKELEEQLSKLSGMRVDNHTVYEIAQDDRPTVYILCSDFSTTFASTLDKRPW